MTQRPGVGVIGLGRRWERYRPALAAADCRLAVRAVYDRFASRAADVAQEFACEVADGIEDLLDRQDLDALLLFDAAWHGLWPLERAARSNKPIFCAAPLTCDDNHADEVVRALLGRPQPTMSALATDSLPAAARLRVLLEHQLGPPRLVSCSVHVSRQRTCQALLNSGALLPAFQLCRELLGEAPDTVWTAAPSGSGMVNVSFGFPEARAVLVSLCSGHGTGWRVVVEAERGVAAIVPPRRLKWRVASGQHSLRLPPYSKSKDLLRRFAEAVVTERQPRPTFAEVMPALAWLRAARKSHAENSPVRLADG
jgi:predicted dehydrogenase